MRILAVGFDQATQSELKSLSPHIRRQALFLEPSQAIMPENQKSEPDLVICSETVDIQQMTLFGVPILRFTKNMSPEDSITEVPHLWAIIENHDIQKLNVCLEMFSETLKELAES